MSKKVLESSMPTFLLHMVAACFLNKTFLKLYKGHRYGIVGRNGAGKSTLMRSISLGKLEGFPDKSELRTCFVEHKLQGEEGDMDLVSLLLLIPNLLMSASKIFPRLLKRLALMTSDVPKMSVLFQVGGR